MPSSLTVTVLTYDNEFNEIVQEAKFMDISRGGARFAYTGELEMGQMVQLDFLMPKVMRAFDQDEPRYKIWGVVRWVVCVLNPENNKLEKEIGVAFTGKHPPDGYLAHPTKRYDIRPVPTANKLWIVREMRGPFMY